MDAKCGTHGMANARYSGFVSTPPMATRMYCLPSVPIADRRTCRARWKFRLPQDGAGGLVQRTEFPSARTRCNGPGDLRQPAAGMHHHRVALADK